MRHCSTSKNNIELGEVVADVKQFNHEGRKEKQH